MPTILELARYADVSTENVIRVVRGEPVSTSVAERVREAIEALGPPTRGGEDVPAPRSDLVRARDELLIMLRRSQRANGAETGEADAGSLLEALRGEVRPVSADVAHLLVAFDWMTEGLSELKRSARRDRVERIEDLELMIDLLTNGWRSVDRRLGRVELVLQRIEAKLDRLR